MFALQSGYWAAGGTVGASTVGPAIAEPVLDRDPTWVAALWGITAAKVIGSALPLAAFRQRTRWLRVATLVAGILIALYGATYLADHGLMVSGVNDIPGGLGETAARWHLLFWDPWWLLGGVLYIGTARAAGGLRPRRP